MNCKNCSKNISEDFIYCPYCGEKIIEDENVNDDITFKITNWEQNDLFTTIYVMIINDSKYKICDIVATFKFYDKHDELIDCYITNEEYNNSSLSFNDICSGNIGKVRIHADGILPADKISASFTYNLK